MTSSEQRLHPASILFDIARYARMFAWPALLAFFGIGRQAVGTGRYDFDVSGVEVWLWVLIVPSVALSLARYLTFRIDYAPDALVIRSGIIFKNVRHVPYARIQNLDAVRNPFHRALGVVEVRVETGGGGGEPEARLKVLPESAIAEMRARVFAGRAAVAPFPRAGEEAAAAADGDAARGLDDAAVADADAAAAAEGVTLLHLPIKELLLCGFLENRGMVLVGAAYGALWQMGLQDRVWSWMFSTNIDARDVARGVVLALMGREPLSLNLVAIGVGGVAAFLLLVRLISMAWAFLRLYDFRLTRHGDDLRVQFGFFTQVAATIPLRRIQSVTVQRGWLHRWLGRAAVRVETAGGRAGAATRDREWVAPLVREHDLPALLAQVLPGVDVASAAWHGVHPRAFRRAVKPVLLVAVIPSVVALSLLGWRAVPLVAMVVAWMVLRTRQHVRHLSWAAGDDLVAFRSGWFNRHDTLVRTSRIQAVTTEASPFDRRAVMARLRVDTAGAGELSHRIDIPYLAADLATRLRAQLSRRAAHTAFRW